MNLINISNKKRLLTIFLTFLFGVISQPYLTPSYLKRIYHEGNLLFKILSQPNKSISSHCIPRKIKYVPKNSTIVIGHAYGSGKGSEDRGNIGIAPKVKTFYDLNKKNIDMIIFSGDVLNEPSINRWNNFYSAFEKDLRIYIAPGNHDVSSSTSESAKRDIFELINHRNMKGNQFPFYFSWQGNLFIIDDSNRSEKESLGQIYSLINNLSKYKSIFVIRHHVLTKSLEFASNERVLKSLIKDSELKIEDKNNSNKNITFIYGDGGESKYYPRIACLRIGNINHIVNGIGEVPGDTVLIINNKKIYRTELN